MDRRVLKRVQSVQYYGTINRCAIIGANYDKCPGRADESVPRGLFFQVEHGAVGKPRGANIAPSRTPSDSLLHASRSESGCSPRLQGVLLLSVTVAGVHVVATAGTSGSLNLITHLRDPLLARTHSCAAALPPTRAPEHRHAPYTAPPGPRCPVARIACWLRAAAPPHAD